MGYTGLPEQGGTSILKLVTIMVAQWEQNEAAAGGLEHCLTVGDLRGRVQSEEITAEWVGSSRLFPCF